MWVWVWYHTFFLLPYGLCCPDCKSSLLQREDLGGNVSMGVVSHLFLLPYGLCRRDCKSSLLQREDLGGNVSMGVESHLFLLPYGLCRPDCKSSLLQREDLGGNVSMSVESHLFLYPYGYKKRCELFISHRYNRIPLLASAPGGFCRSWSYKTHTRGQK